MNKWINVDDRLPEPEDVVLVYDRLFVDHDKHNNSKSWGGFNQPGVRLGALMPSGWFRSQGVNGECEITHWMPLPEPPEQI